MCSDQNMEISDWTHSLLVEIQSNLKNIYTQKRILDSLKNENTASTDKLIVLWNVTQCLESIFTNFTV